MKFFVQVVAITLLAWMLELVLPWWSIALAAFVVCVFIKTKVNFLAGFLAIFLLWVLTAYLIDVSSVAPLADRVAAIFQLPKIALILITGLLGGLAAGFGAMAGSAVRK